MAPNNYKYCLCRGPDDGRLMVACDKCNEWFHAACMNIHHQGKLSVAWFCPMCKSAMEVEQRLSKLIEEKENQFQEQFLLHIHQKENTVVDKYTAKDNAKQNVEVVDGRRLSEAQERIIILEEEVKAVMEAKEICQQNLEAEKKKCSEAEKRIIDLEEEIKVIRVEKRKLEIVLKLESEEKTFLSPSDLDQSDTLTHFTEGHKDGDFDLADQSPSKRKEGSKKDHTFKMTKAAPSRRIRFTKLSLHHQKIKAQSQP